MKIFEKLRRKSQTEEVKQEEQQTQKAPFMADISMFELERADWTKFAGELKKNRILPNSYIKKPADVKVSLGENNRPMILLTFKSATSDSVREFLFLQDGVFQSVNGKVDDGKNQALNDMWKKFQEEIRYLNYLNTTREGSFHRMRGERMKKMAEKLMGMDNIYVIEQEFLEKYKDAIFDDFYYDFTYEIGEIPAFELLQKREDGTYYNKEKVTPFSPKTLELCISKMTNGCRAEQGEYVPYFTKKCRKIQELSCFESPDWDRVIGYGEDIVKTAYQAAVLDGSYVR